MTTVYDKKTQLYYLVYDRALYDWLYNGVCFFCRGSGEDRIIPSESCRICKGTGEDWRNGK